MTTMSRATVSSSLKTLAEKKIITVFHEDSYIIVHHNITIEETCTIKIEDRNEAMSREKTLIESEEIEPDCDSERDTFVAGGVPQMLQGGCHKSGTIELISKTNIKTNIYTDGVTSQKEEADEIIQIWCKAKLKGHEDMGFKDQFAGKLIGWSRDKKISLEKLKKAVLNYAKIKEDKNIAYDNNWSLPMFLGLVGGQFRGERFFDENFDISQFKKLTQQKTVGNAPSKEHEASLEKEKQQRIREKMASHQAPVVRSQEEIRSLRQTLKDIISSVKL